MCSGRIKPRPPVAPLASNGADGSASPGGAGVKSIALLLAVLSLGAAALAAGSPEQGLDWKAWRSLPVQDRGRRKPLDTLAAETLGSIANRTSFTDPETGRTLDATGLYLSMLFDPQGQDADKWDREPLILVKSPELREALDMAGGQRHLSAHDLREAEIEDPHTHAKAPFLAMARQLSARMTPPTASLDKAVLDVADAWRPTRSTAWGENSKSRLRPTANTSNGCPSCT